MLITIVKYTWDLPLNLGKTFPLSNGLLKGLSGHYSAKCSTYTGYRCKHEVHITGIPEHILYSQTVTK